MQLAWSHHLSYPLPCWSVSQESLNGLQNLTADSDRLKVLGSFAAGCVLAGDALVVPCGAVVVEKFVNDNCMGLRVPLHIVHSDDEGSMEMLLNQFPEILVRNILKTLGVALDFDQLMLCLRNGMTGFLNDFIKSREPDWESVRNRYMPADGDGPGQGEMSGSTHDKHTTSIGETIECKSTQASAKQNADKAMDYDELPCDEKFERDMKLALEHPLLAEHIRLLKTDPTLGADLDDDWEWGDANSSDPEADLEFFVKWLAERGMTLHIRSSQIQQNVPVWQHQPKAEFPSTSMPDTASIKPPALSEPPASASLEPAAKDQHTGLPGQSEPPATALPKPEEHHQTGLPGQSELSASAVSKPEEHHQTGLPDQSAPPTSTLPEPEAHHQTRLPGQSEQPATALAEPGQALALVPIPCQTAFQHCELPRANHKPKVEEIPQALTATKPTELSKPASDAAQKLDVGCPVSTPTAPTLAASSAPVALVVAKTHADGKTNKNDTDQTEKHQKKDKKDKKEKKEKKDKKDKKTKMPGMTQKKQRRQKIQKTRRSVSTGMWMWKKKL